jgi:flagellar basal-body rod modification protein FlgD
MSSDLNLSPALLAKLNGNNGTTASTSQSGSATGTGAPALNELDFLNLMMQQLKNQDPTKPMDNAAVMGQLAQFGTVSGINQLNSSFGTLSSQLVSTQALQASSLLGHNVLVAGATAPLASGGTIAGAVEVPASAGAVTVQVVDASGAVVRTLPLGTPATGLASFSWDGRTDTGATAPPGTYGLAASGSVNGKGTQLATLVSGQVASITLGGGTGGLTLHLAGLGDVPFSSVQQIN